MSVAEKMIEAQDRMLTEMEAAQARIVEMNQKMAEVVTGAMPAEFEAPSLPGMDEMPKPTEMVDRYFDFTAKMAEANRSFYKEMFSAWSPATVAAPAKSKKTKSSK